MKILILQPIAEHASVWLKHQGADVLLGYDDHEWRDRAQDVEGLIYYSSGVDRELLDALPSLRVVGKRGAGVEKIDHAEVARRGIQVTNIGAGPLADSVAEHAVMLLFAATRSLIVQDSLVRQGKFADRRTQPLCKPIVGTRLGLVGGGNIGRRISEMLQGGFDCQVGLFDPYVGPEDAARMGVEQFATLSSLFDWADNAIVAAPFTPETEGMIGKAEIDVLGPDGVLVVVSRGGIVDETPLFEALRVGSIRAAGLDVFATEPPPDDHPFFDLNNVAMTPHLAAGSDASRRSADMQIAQYVWDLLNHRPAPLISDQKWFRAMGD